MTINYNKVLSDVKSLNSEYGECCTLADYLALLKHQGKVLKYSHIPNETYTTSWNQKNKNKRMGVDKGIPDYLVLLANRKSLWVEMKKVKGGTVSKEQKEWLECLELCGYEVSVCKGFDEAKAFINQHI